jgi:alkanesulfonate monooxygenase SsuD/methylene tetrahydromethanopterin reductase-like flavin-dependent oxidoreductase (luciferase family)
MHYGIYIPVFGEYASPSTLADLACEAELAGWDGFYIWDHVLFSQTLQFTDPWIALSAIALKTKKIRLGPLVTPLPRRRPWKVARETVAIDHLSGGRLIQGVGIGGDWWREYSGFGEVADAKIHSAMLDESLEVLAGLWSGSVFTYHGKYYQVNEVQFLPTPIQAPHIPIWTTVIWPNKPPLKRAARWDGIFPLQSKGPMTPDNIREMLSYIQRYRTNDRPFDVVFDHDVSSSINVDIAIIDEYARAGVTWWLESFDYNHSTEMVQKYIRQGPPRKV